MSAKTEQHMSLMTEIADMYYLKHLTQAEIAATLYISRPSVSRLLKKAEEEGIVEIKINRFLKRNYHLEELMKKTFDLKEARILSCPQESEADILHSLGRLAAEYIDSKLESGMTLGISWGRSVKAVVDELHSSDKGPINIVQIMGATANEIGTSSAQRLVRQLADIYNGQAYYLNAPLFTEDDYVCQTLRKNPAVSVTLQQAANADIIVTGIGAQNDIRIPKKASDLGAGWMQYLTEEIIQEINKKKAVGCLAAQFFDKNGTPIKSLWSRNCIGITLQELKRVPNVIGIASGHDKVNAIRGALLGSYITGLVTDAGTATEILQANITSA